MLATIQGKKWKINWHHELFKEPYALTLPSGKEKLVRGFTQITATNLNDEMDEHEAFSWCSVQDVFRKDKGRKESLTVLINDVMELPRNERKEVWKAYHER